MVDKYDNLAKDSGARIVSFCGHDCVPWDLTGKLQLIECIHSKLKLLSM